MATIIRKSYYTRPLGMVNAEYGESNSGFKYLLNAYQWAAGVIIAILGAMQKLTPYDLELLPDWTRPPIAWVIPRVWWLVPALAVGMALAKFWKQRIESVWVWSVVKNIIDRIADDAFKETAGPRYHHRATLFRHQWKWLMWPFRSMLWPWGRRGQKFRWPWSGWLVPVIRSGNTTQKSSTVFLAPDDPDHAEGVAGFIWASRRSAAKQFRCAVDKDSQAFDVSEYARETFVEEEWVKRQLDDNKTLAASFTGYPIEAKGRTWGVLLLDSRDPTAALSLPANIADHAFVLGKLLERV